jgi:hypothetical protein
MDGKLISRFNEKGGMGYIFIEFVAYDEEADEIFIKDLVKYMIYVYSGNGTLKRKLDVSRKLRVSEIYNFDDTTLLVYNEYSSSSDTRFFDYPYPWVFISKDDGSILSSVNIKFEKPNPTVLFGNRTKNPTTGEVETGFFSKDFTAPDNCKFGDEFYLSNRSMDTIFVLKKDKSLTPIFTQTPSVFSKYPSAVTVGLVTDKFIDFTIYPIDLERMKLDAEKKIKSKSLLKKRFVFATGEFYNLLRGWGVQKIDIPKNMSVSLIQAENVLFNLRNGVYDKEPELKKQFSNVKFDDNHVVQITKYR